MPHLNTADEQVRSLQQYLRQYPHIRFAAPGTDGYDDLRAAYIIDSPAVPLAIVRPQSADDVSVLVTYCVAQGIGMSVRSGGHDIFGRCFAQDALAIDMRDIRYVQVDRENNLARIGGGILAGHLAKELSKNGLATAVGSHPTVGYTGWATHGGYGPCTANFGLGVDQIVGAKFVNYDGQLVEADDSMLQAIRGAGGALGVICELTIRVFPLAKVLGGIILYDTSTSAATVALFSGVQELNKNGLPSELGIQQSIVNTPNGRVFVIGFMWSSSDLDTGRLWLDRVSALGKALINTVKETTLHEWLEDSGRMVPDKAYGGNCTVSVREITSEIIEVIGEETAKMPDDAGTLLSIHQLRGPSAKSSQKSVFAAREPHYVFEFIATTNSQKQAKNSWKWASNFRAAMEGTDAGNVMTETYISLTPPQRANLCSLYGSQYQQLMQLKKRYDPRNIFRHSMLQFPKAANGTV